MSEPTRLSDELSGVDDPEAMLEGLFVHAPVAIQIFRADGHTLVENEAFRRLFGGPPPHAYNVFEDEILERAGFRELVQRAFAGETVRIPAHWYDPRELKRVKVPLARRVAIEGTLIPLLDSTGAIHHVALCVKDMSSEFRLKEASDSLSASHEALRISEARYRTQFEAAPEAIVTLDLARGSFVEVNENAERLFGYSRGELLKLHPLDLCPELQPDGTRSEDLMRGNIARVLQGEHLVFEWIHRNAKGEQFPCEVRLVRLPGLGENLCRGSVIDISDRRRLERALAQAEEQLRQSQKMEAIGRLAGGVAHDFNNLLSVILSYSSMLLAKLKSVDPIRTDIEAIKEAGERAAQLTRQLLTFSRQQLLMPRVLSLNEVIAEGEKMLRRLLGEDVELVTRYEPNLAYVRIDPGQVDQIIMNLAVNARDAMPQGGKLTIETKNVHLDADFAAEHLGVEAGSHVMLAVSDTGTGMDKATQARIFEPFFTTKDRGRGTGLGLATVFGIVKQSSGTIWVYSEVGSGSTFKVYLPESRVGPTPSPSVPEPTTLRGTETILLVEDQNEVRIVAREILVRHGYHVLEAQNAGEALLRCERHPRTIHLLLTDVVMPQMNGQELAERLHQVRPAMRILYMSGYTESAAVQHAMLDSGSEFLQKPIVPDALARRVREVLDAPLRTSTSSRG